MMAKPDCLGCGRPSKKLKQAPKELLFCSLRCAALWGIENAQMTQEWCEKHRVWHHGDQTCDECDEDEMEEYEESAKAEAPT